MRVATAADISSIVRITNAAFGVEIFLNGTRTDEEHLSAQMQKGHFLVEEDAAHHVLASIYIELRGERGYFGMLAVEPGQQGQGIGRRLIKAAEDHCRWQGCAAMDIAVLSLRKDLLPFYHKLGYIETATEPFRPSRPLKSDVECHCITMSKVL